MPPGSVGDCSSTGKDETPVNGEQTRRDQPALFFPDLYAMEPRVWQLPDGDNGKASHCPSCARQ